LFGHARTPWVWIGKLGRTGTVKPTNDTARAALGRSAFRGGVAVLNDPEAGDWLPQAEKSHFASSKEVQPEPGQDDDHADQAYRQHVSHIMTGHALACFRRALYDRSIMFSH
jgi:hypothetical protein